MTAKRLERLRERRNPENLKQEMDFNQAICLAFEESLQKARQSDFREIPSSQGSGPMSGTNVVDEVLTGRIASIWLASSKVP